MDGFSGPEPDAVKIARPVPLNRGVEHSSDSSLVSTAIWGNPAGRIVASNHDTSGETPFILRYMLIPALSCWSILNPHAGHSNVFSLLRALFVFPHLLQRFEV